MSSKKAMKQAQKQAFAKHRSNIVNSRFKLKNKISINNEEGINLLSTCKKIERFKEES